MKSEHMLMYVLVFVLGFMVARMMSGRPMDRGNMHLMVDDEQHDDITCKKYKEACAKNDDCCSNNCQNGKCCNNSNGLFGSGVDCSISSPSGSNVPDEGQCCSNICESKFSGDIPTCVGP